MPRILTRAAVAAGLTAGIIQTGQTIWWWWQILTTTPWGWL